MSVIIALANQKGGVGKTTSTVSLAAALAGRGLRVLVVDADPQANATSALGVDPPVDETGAASPGLYFALIDDQPLAPFVTWTRTENLAIVPTTPDLAGVEVELVSMMAREYRMKRALDPLRPWYDLILIDCPPSLGLLTVNALAAADEVIIPVQCEYFALEGLGHLQHTVQLVRKNLNPELLLRGVLLTMFDARTNLARQVEAEVRAHFPNTFRAVIPRSVRLSEAPSYGEPIQRYDPLSAGARAYDDLADELVAMLAGPQAGPPPDVALEVPTAPEATVMPPDAAPVIASEAGPTPAPEPAPPIAPSPPVPAPPVPQPADNAAAGWPPADGSRSLEADRGADKRPEAERREAVQEVYGVPWGAGGSGGHHDERSP